MKTEEGNRIIAEFMGWTLGHPNPEEKRWKTNWFNPDGYRHTHLQFDWSWDWLMPVIDKITSMDKYPRFKDHTSSMIDQEGGIYINPKYIENTYEQVVEFIEWYNKQPK